MPRATLTIENSDGSTETVVYGDDSCSSCGAIHTDVDCFGKPVTATPAFADEEIAERIAAWLTKQADAYAATRKAGGDVEDEFRWAEVYARSLAAAIRRGEWR